MAFSFSSRLLRRRLLVLEQAHIFRRIDSMLLLLSLSLVQPIHWQSLAEGNHDLEESRLTFSDCSLHPSWPAKEDDVRTTSTAFFFHHEEVSVNSLEDTRCNPLLVIPIWSDQPAEGGGQACWSIGEWRLPVMTRTFQEQSLTIADALIPLPGARATPG